MSPQIRSTQFLGRIEIKTADKIERVYFEIDENNIEQWEKPQIRESKKAFFYVTITEGGDKEKLECFVDFCEDAIFEMQHADSLIRDGTNSIEEHFNNCPLQRVGCFVAINLAVGSFQD